MSELRIQPVVYTLRCTDGPATDAWRVYGFRMREAINEPYHMVVELVTDQLDSEFEQLLGASVELEILRSDSCRELFGVVSAVEELGVSAGSYAQLRLEIQPAFALLAQRVNSRLWQDASALDIIAEVLGEALGEYGRSHEAGGVSGGQDVRSYCVQYNE